MKTIIKVNKLFKNKRYEESYELYIQAVDKYEGNIISYYLGECEK